MGEIDVSVGVSAPTREDVTVEFRDFAAESYGIARVILVFVHGRAHTAVRVVNSRIFFVCGKYRVKINCFAVGLSESLGDFLFVREHRDKSRRNGRPAREMITVQSGQAERRIRIKRERYAVNRGFSSDFLLSVHINNGVRDRIP